MNNITQRIFGSSRFDKKIKKDMKALTEKVLEELIDHIYSKGHAYELCCLFGIESILHCPTGLRELIELEPAFGKSCLVEK